MSLNFKLSEDKLTTAGSWTSAILGEYRSFNLESIPLEISTNTLIKNWELKVNFKTSRLQVSGGVIISLSSYTPQYRLPWCSLIPAYTDFPVKLSSDTEKIWRIILTRSAGVRVRIECNKKEVADVVLSDSWCGNSRWSEYWSKETAFIEFDFSDTVSNYYREAQTPGY